MKKIRIRNKVVGGGRAVFVIAELGSNHDGKLGQAMELIDAAAQAGCDAVKIQLPIAGESYPPGAKFGGIYGQRKIVSIIKKNEIPEGWVPRLADHAHKKGLGIGASTDGFTGLGMILNNPIDFIKIPSFTISNIPLLEEAGGTNIPWLLSTGVHALGEVEEALKAVGPAPAAIFHCISSYPAPLADLNLNNIPFLKEAFGIPVGFSDHSMHYARGPVLAAALGADMIEKHFTLDRRFKGTDHFFAVEPGELKEMVGLIRKVGDDADFKDSILRDPGNRPLFGKARNGIFKSEQKIYKKTRLGLYFTRDMKRNSILKKGDIGVLRCADTRLGLPARYMGLMCGARLLRDAGAYEAVDWPCFIDYGERRKTCKK